MFQVHLSRQYNHTSRNNFFYADTIDEASDLVRALFTLGAVNGDNGRIWISIQEVDKPMFHFKF